jgi:hypothetical protein
MGITSSSTSEQTNTTRFFCHQCKVSFSKTVNPNEISNVKCARCGSEFVEVIPNNATIPEDYAAEVPEASPTRHGIFSTFLNLPQVQHTISNQQPTGPQQIAVGTQRLPNGFTYIVTDPSSRVRYQVYQTSSTSVPEEAKGVQEEEKKAQRVERSNSRQWQERVLAQNLGTYMNGFLNEVNNMNWGEADNQNPYAPNFMGGLVFGRAFPQLRLGDFFSESDSIHPSNLGINLQDFGLNFASNFGRGNLIDLVQLISMSDPVSSGKPPASKEVLSKLPVFKLEEKHCKKTAEGKIENPNCAVCCNDIKLGDKAQLIPCGHMFHPECIKPWFMQHNTCPICRYELPTDDPYYEEIRKNNARSHVQQ